MHLLVLSAFRLYAAIVVAAHFSPSQCTFWCSVLSDFTRQLWLPLTFPRLNAPFGAQCFPTVRRFPLRWHAFCLNAPFGAQCFPTGGAGSVPDAPAAVSMHLLVLSAFRRARGYDSGDERRSQCTFWCSVLSDPDGSVDAVVTDPSQCTFWCSVLSDRNGDPDDRAQWVVSMHLLVLSAFRRFRSYSLAMPRLRLNAPFGAQCFPTKFIFPVAHKFEWSQCTFWCSVLSDRKKWQRHTPTPLMSQCTFWCSVLSDENNSCGNDSPEVSMHLLVLSAFRLPGQTLCGG